MLSYIYKLSVASLRTTYLYLAKSLGKSIQPPSQSSERVKAENKAEKFRLPQHSENLTVNH